MRWKWMNRIEKKKNVIWLKLRRAETNPNEFDTLRSNRRYQVIHNNFIIAFNLILTTLATLSFSLILYCFNLPCATALVFWDLLLQIVVIIVISLNVVVCSTFLAHDVVVAVVRHLPKNINGWYVPCVRACRAHCRCQFDSLEHLFLFIDMINYMSACIHIYNVCETQFRMPVNIYKCCLIMELREFKNWLHTYECIRERVKGRENESKKKRKKGTNEWTNEL